MADFGELCPLFNTGVYHEVTIGPILSVSSVSSTMNLLEGLCTAGLGGSVFTFGRTVVVTDAWVQRMITNAENENLIIGHRTTQSAAATAFGTVNITTTISVNSVVTWQAITLSSSKTFTSSEVLSLGVGTLTALTQPGVFLTVRYREK